MIRLKEVEDHTGWYLSGKVVDIINKLKELSKEYGPETELDFDAWVEHDSVCTKLVVKRPENDKERLAREKQEAKSAQDSKEWRRKQFETLKKEFNED